MADIEKVIKGLRFCFDETLGIVSCDGCVYSDSKTFKNGVTHCYLVDDVISLLKKQEAETVESIQVSRNFFAELTGYCPSCKRPLKEHFNKFFCGNCGQAVKWE